MKTFRIILLDIFLFLPFVGFGQKIVELPSNKLDTTYFEFINERLAEYDLIDLTKTQDSIHIRVWMGQFIVEITKNASTNSNLIISSYCEYPKKSRVLKKINIDSITSRRIFDKLISRRILDLPNDRIMGIDGQQYLFEISTINKYRLYSYWSPNFLKDNENRKTAGEIVSELYNLLDLKNHEKEFFNEIESGKYYWGMSEIDIDYLLPEEQIKSALYILVENKLKTDFGITEKTDHQNYPTINIDKKQIFLKDLNNYKYSKIKRITVYKNPNQTNGIFGRNGLIFITTK